MIYIKAKRSADKASAIFLRRRIHKKQRVLQHVQQLRYYRTQSLLQYPFKFTVKGVKSVVTAPTRIDSL
jgi:hypothetical protein